MKWIPLAFAGDEAFSNCRGSGEGTIMRLDNNTLIITPSGTTGAVDDSLAGMPIEILVYP